MSKGVSLSKICVKHFNDIKVRIPQNEKKKDQKGDKRTEQKIC